MADSVTAQETQYPTHEEGQFAAVCADVINLGQYVERYQDNPPRLVAKCAIVFVTNTTGEVKTVSGEFTVTMSDRGKLRPFLEHWRGKGYTPEQAAAGVVLDKLENHGALLSIEHHRSLKGKTYARISSIAPLPKEIPAPSVTGYARDEFWAKKKKTYADDAAKFRGSPVARNEEPVQPVEEDDDDLPF